MKIGSRGLLLSVLLFVAVAALRAEETGDVAIATQAKALAPAGSSTAGRITAIHRFVRDEIRQVTTQWG